MTDPMSDPAQSGMGWGTDTGVCAEADVGLWLRFWRAAAEIGRQGIIAPAGRAAAKCQAPAAVQ